MTWILPIVGPVWMVLRTWLPAVSALRSAAIGAVALTAVVAGAWLVWTLRHEDETPRIERAARVIVERANLAAHVEELEAAVKQSGETLAEREAALAASQRELAKLKKAQEDKRAQSPKPNDPVIPAGDPWLDGVRQ